jgi:hypothetical protein
MPIGSVIFTLATLGSGNATALTGRRTAAGSRG